ncbi:MAG: carbamoyl-phosphate synthase large subunit [bacterium]|nr:carbamoyl-phosphate synthase large subunit [bacterium]
MSQRIIVLGTGAITIGEGSEFNGAVTAACRTLRAMGHTVILIESHTAALAADARLAHVTYLEPLQRQSVEKIIIKERPHAVLATASGRSAFNLALVMQQVSQAMSQRFSMFGASREVLENALNPEQVARVLHGTQARTPQAYIVTKKKHGEDLGRQMGFPVVVRALYGSGSLGTSLCYNTQELQRAIDVALAVSPVEQVVLEKSLAGRRRTEWAVVRDQRDHVQVLGSVEFLDPLGVHSADTPAVTPAQSLAPEQVQHIHSIVSTVVRRLQLVGAVTVQLAHDSANDEITVVSIAPYVTRTTMLCSRATGVPLVEWHTRLCGGEVLADLRARLQTPADDLFAGAEAAAQVCWCRVPIFPGGRLMGTQEALSTAAKSVGAAYGVGDTWLAALQKAIAAAGRPPLGAGFVAPREAMAWSDDDLRTELGKASAARLWYVYHAVALGMTGEELAEITGMALWFLQQLAALYAAAQRWQACMPKDFIASTDLQHDLLLEAKQQGGSDEQLARALSLEPARFRAHRHKQGVTAACRLLPSRRGVHGARRAVCCLDYGPQAHPPLHADGAPILLIGGSTSLLHGSADFDYMLAHAALELAAHGHASVLLTPNALHVANELDLALRHYIEAITPEALGAVVALERPAGVMLQFADRQPAEITEALRTLNVPVLGTPLPSMERLLRRDRFQTLLQKLDIRQPSHGVAHNAHEAYQVAHDVGYPVIVHPAHPLHRPRVAIWYDDQDARAFLEQATRVAELYPLSVEEFLEAAHEFHVEAVTDGTAVHIAGVVEHVEEAGIHSADSAAVWPTCTLPPEIVNESRAMALCLAGELELRGTIGLKCAYADGRIYLLDVLPVTTRTTALIHSAAGNRLVPLITRVLLGQTLSEEEAHEWVGDYLAVRAPVFPFAHYPDSDAALGPDNCAMGQAIGLDPSFGVAYAKALLGAGNKLPTKGCVLLSVAEHDKAEMLPLARKLRALGFSLIATRGTAAILQQNGIPTETIKKMHEGRPNVMDHIIDGHVQLIINTPGGKANRKAEALMRHEAADRGILVITTRAGARATVEGIEAFMRRGFDVLPRERYTETLRLQRILPLDTQATLNLA